MLILIWNSMSTSPPQHRSPLPPHKTPALFIRCIAHHQYHNPLIQVLGHFCEFNTAPTFCLDLHRSSFHSLVLHHGFCIYTIKE
ncbi:unnamed protein product [Haemonchus placei]|uniref:Ovule protein n=1 Tax=Haemonchus placei TaxID=6290 RepID=A0A0N4VTM5_HAEPC|nr:unnamed protein product [Haemonchus placei]